MDIVYHHSARNSLFFGSCFFICRRCCLVCCSAGIQFAIFAVMKRDWENRQQISYYNEMMNPK